MLSKMEGGGDTNKVLEMFDDFAEKIHRETDEKIKAVKERM